jgi:type I restriction enzyme S subunit
MKLPSYPKNKHGDTPWLASIPEHWEARRLKFMAEVCNGRDQKEVIDDDGAYDIFGSGGVFGKSSEYLYDQVSVLLGRKGTIDRPLYIERPFWTVDTMFYTQIAKEVHPKYFFYLCLTIPFDYHRDQTTLPSMTQSGLSEVRFAFAPPDEQQQIAAFLDWKTGQIDALIVKKQELLEKLKENRIAIITQAVTQGINPSAPLRDSGIPWLGQVPKHWEVPALKFRYTVELGKMLDEKRLTGEHSIPYLRNVDVQWNQINYEDLPVMDIASDEYARYTIREGDVLACEGGEVGRSAVVREQSGVIGFQKAIHRLRADSIDELPTFVYYTLVWAVNTGIFSAEGSSTIAHLTADQLRRYRFPQPPLCEQETIVAYLEDKVGQMNKLAAKVESAIDRLTEYRTALITDATTGKIDVRAVKIPAIT